MAVERLTPVASLVSVTDAFGTAAPDGSVERPVTLPRGVWARRAEAQIKKINGANRIGKHHCSRMHTPSKGRSARLFTSPHGKLKTVDKQNRALIAGFAGAVAALIVFGWLANQVFHRATIQFDAAIRDGVHSFASPGLTWFFRIVTEFGSEMFLVPFGAFVVWRLATAGRQHAAILFAVAAAGGEALDYVLKLLFHRTRPVVFFGLTEPRTYSFPSGHSMLSACFFGVLAALVTMRMASYAQKLAVWAAAAAATLLIGVSRVYLGVHYPSDVLAGYAAAVIWVFSVRAGYAVWLRRRAAAGPSHAAPEKAGVARGQPPREDIGS